MKVMVKATDKRNEMHFDVQRKNRMVVWENKKAYNRKRLPKPIW